MAGQSSSRGKADGEFSFLQRIIALFLGTSDEEREKRRLLKQLGKDLSKQRYRFYKPRSGEALGGLGRLFFEIYRVVGPAQSLLQGTEDSSALKTILIEMNHSEDQEALRAEFDEPQIRELSQKMSNKELVAHVRESMVSYFSRFDSSVAKRINDTFSAIQAFGSFARFDYYFVLRKFDSALPEGDFLYNPRFETINGEYVSDDIKDFLEVLIPLHADADWDTAFDALSEYRGVEIVNRQAWNKLLSSLDAVAGSGILTKIVQHIDDDPSFQPMVHTDQNQIVEAYLTKLKNQVETSIQKQLRERRGRKIEELLTAVFGTTSVATARYYTESANEVFGKKALAGFLHTDAINYLKAFLVDYFKRDVRVAVSELLIVRARWSDTNLSQQLSDSFHAVMNVAQAVVEFDDSLGPDGDLGIKLKRASGRVVEKDASTMKMLRQSLSEVNEHALEMVNGAANNLITLAKIVKTLIADNQKLTPDVVLNWKELEGFAEKPIRQTLVSVYNRIYYFIQLMQLYVKQ